MRIAFGILLTIVVLLAFHAVGLDIWETSSRKLWGRKGWNHRRH
jgi:hypothetical protein